MKESINRQIIKLAWPAIATNITTPLLSLVDVAIVGHIGGKELYVGAVAVGGTAFNILYWVFAFLRMGTSGMSAQAYGAGANEEQRSILRRGLTIAVMGSAMLLFLAPLVGWKAISIIDGSGEVQELAWHYFRIAIWGAPGVLVSYVLSGWLLGMQRSKSVMWIALTTNVLNILLSTCFVFILNLGLSGVAMGTAISQIAGATFGGFTVARICRKMPKKSEKELHKTNIRNSWGKIFRINSDIFLRTMCLAAVTLWFTHAGSLMGAEILAANSLMLQLFLVFSYFMDGFAFGGEALAGRYYGAREIKTLQKTVKSLFKWGIWTSLIFTVLYFVASDLFISWLTSDNGIINVSSKYRMWIVLVPLAGFSAFTWDGIMIGLTQTRTLMLSMGIAMGIFFIVYFFGKAHYENANHVLWLAFILYLSVRGIVSTLLYRRFIGRLVATSV